MKIRNLISISFLLLLLNSCNTVKKSYESGSYDYVVDRFVVKSEKHELDEKEIAMLNDSYHQANEEDFKRIMELRKSGLPNIWVEVYKRTKSIDDRCKKMSDLPINVLQSIDYRKLALDNELENSKRKAETFLVAKSYHMLINSDYEDIKEVESLVKELNKINPSNEYLEDLRLRLVIKSYNHILFRVATPIELYLPNDFAKLVLDFDENNLYGVPFDVVPDGDDDYDLMIRIMVEEDLVSPSLVETVRFEEAKGDVKAIVTDKTMRKSATINGYIEFIDVNKDKILVSTPFDVTSTFVHKYAEVEGDLSACSEHTISLMNVEVVDFPTDEALIRDAARKLNELLKTHYQKK